MTHQKNMDPRELTGFASQAGQSISNHFTGAMNTALSERMYNRQKADALEFWNMQNEYNSPIKQKERLEAAGLNPALMYGKGAASGAVSGNALGIKNPSPTTAQQMNTASSLASEIASVEQARMMKMQTDLTSEKVEEQRIKNMIEALKIPTKQGYYSGMEYSLDFYGAGGDEGFKLTENQAAKAYQEARRLIEQGMNNQWTKEMAARIANLESITSLNNSKDVYQQITNFLAENGLSWGDPTDLRTIAVRLHNNGIINIPTYVALTGGSKFIIKMASQLGGASLIGKGLSKIKGNKPQNYGQLKSAASEARTMYNNRPISGHIPFD